MAEEYEWRITLADDSVVNEADGLYQLAWEEKGAVKKFELIGEQEMSVDLEKGEFVVEGKKNKLQGITGDHTDKALWFRKRKQVRTDGTAITHPANNFMFGFLWQGNLYEAGIRPVGNIVKEPKKEKKPSHLK